MKRVDLGSGGSSVSGCVRVHPDNEGLRPCQCLALLWKGVTTGLRTRHEVRLNSVYTHTHACTNTDSTHTMLDIYIERYTETIKHAQGHRHVWLRESTHMCAKNTHVHRTMISPEAHKSAYAQAYKHSDVKAHSCKMSEKEDRIG